MIDIPGLGSRDRRTLEAILEPLRGNHRLFLFGSRATASWQEYSDIDILVEGEGPVPLELLSRVETELEESDLPFSVDLVDARRATAGFVEDIRALLKAV